MSTGGSKFTCCNHITDEECCPSSSVLHSVVYLFRSDQSVLRLKGRPTPLLPLGLYSNVLTDIMTRPVGANEVPFVVLVYALRK